MTQCKEGSQREGLMLDSSEELYKWFTQQVSVWTWRFFRFFLRGTHFERCWNSSLKLSCVAPNSSPVCQHFLYLLIFLSIGHEQLARCFHHESIIRRFEESSCYISSFVQQVDKYWNLLTGLQSSAMLCLQAVYKTTLGLVKSTCNSTLYSERKVRRHSTAIEDWQQRVTLYNLLCLAIHRMVSWIRLLSKSNIFALSCVVTISFLGFTLGGR